MPRRPSKSTGSKPSRNRFSVSASTSAQAAMASSSSAATAADVNSIDIASLTLDVPLQPFTRKKPPSPFHFLSLPAEIRLKIYAYYFEERNTTYDLGPDVYRRVHKKLGIMRVCRLVHEEANYFFYSTRTFRLFPTFPGRYFKSKKPILSRLKPIQRQCITSLELRLGPGWNAPPRGWVVTPALGLNECTSVQRLSIFVENDPSDHFYKGFRRSDGFYEGFCRSLLGSVIDELPNVSIVQFDANPGIRKSGDMMQGLIDYVKESGLVVEWGPERGWTDVDDEADDPPLHWPVPAFGGGVLITNA